MPSSRKIADYRVLCVAVGIVCVLLGLLLGISLNINSHDVLASYRSSAMTVEQGNAMLSNLVQRECDLMLKDNSTDTVMVQKVEVLRDAHDSILQYLSSLRSDFILSVDGVEGERLQRLDDVDFSTNYMINEGHAVELKSHLEEYQRQLLGLFTDPHQRARVEADVVNLTKYQFPNGWVESHFDHAMSVEVVNQLDLFTQQAHIAACRVLQELKGQGRSEENSDN